MSSSDPPAPVPPRTGLSLYANLLDGKPSAGTISRAPVTFAQPGGAQDTQDAGTGKKPPINAAALRFQPQIKRPQGQAQKAKPKAGFPKAPSSGLDASSSDPISKPPGPAASALPAKSTIADWTGNDDDINDFYATEKRQRGGRKRRKKNQPEERVVLQNWDDIYDPSRPNNYEDYKHSEEKYREIREWKDRLYAHRFAKEKKDYSDDMSDASEQDRPVRNQNFAPPGAYSFAPPTSFDDDTVDTAERSASPKRSTSTAHIPTDPSGDDAYARRQQLSQTQSATRDLSQPAPPPQSHPSAMMPPPPPPPSATPSTATISRAPVRYSLPTASTSLPSTEAELTAALTAPDAEPAAETDNTTTTPVPEERSLRPGQTGFAERMMAKMGWTKGSGLGAEGSGMVAPLRVQMDKRKKKSDAEGGGFRAPQTARIIGSKMGKSNKPAGDGGEGGDGNGEKEGPGISEVVMLRGMVDGMDLQKEMEAGLMQEIGDECGEKYGRVERVKIHQADQSGDSIPVFVKFTSQLSALRAVNALEGRVFNGNVIRARFFDSQAFEEGRFE